MPLKAFDTSRMSKLEIITYDLKDFILFCFIHFTNLWYAFLHHKARNHGLTLEFINTGDVVELDGYYKDNDVYSSAKTYSLALQRLVSQVLFFEKKG